ncbi:hypothetical protein ACFYOC_25510 [Nocardiopsis alba]|uniref:hypothetical protein n=1 Tax=Nocardiopsis alba TaxID=53437 RepID=UPI0036B935CC
MTLRDLPPKDHAQGGEDQEAARLLKANPGKWLKVRTSKTRAQAQSTAYRVRTGALAAFRRGFHADAITTETGTHEVWATYQPEPRRATR